MDSSVFTEKGSALFEAYDRDNAGRLPISVVTDLLRRFRLTNETTNKIVDLSGASQLGYFGMAQFHLALKLATLNQTGNKVPLDLLKPRDHILSLTDPVTDSRKPDSLYHNPFATDASVPGVRTDSTTSFRNTGLPNVENNEAALDTLSEISTHLSTASPEILRLRASARCQPEEHHRNLSPCTVETSAPDKWLPFDEDDRSLLTNERVERRDVYMLDHSTHNKCYKSTSFNMHSDNSEDDHRSLYASDSSEFSDPAITLTSAVTGNQVSTLDQTSTTLPVRGVWTYDNVDVPRVTENSQLPVDNHAKPAATEDRSGGFKRFYQSPSGDMYSQLSKTLPSNFQPFSTGYSLEHHRRWLALFTLHPKREAEYAMQFDNLLSSNRTGSQEFVTLADIQHLFFTQHRISPDDLDQIWHLADLDRDNRLSKAEFCLASHLAHLHGNKGLSVEDAVSATASYIATHISTTRNPTNPFQPLVRNAVQFHPVSSTEYLTSQITDDTGRNHQFVDVMDGLDADDDELFVESDEHGETALLPNAVCQTSGSVASRLPCSTVGSAYDSSTENSSSCKSSSLPSSSLTSSSTSSSDFDSFDDEEEEDTEKEHGMSSAIRAEAKLNSRKKKHIRIDPVQLLAIMTGRRSSRLSRYSKGYRQRLLTSLIREAKNANHVMVRLNNEMQAESIDLKDQRVNLNAQLQRLGVEPPS